MNKATLLFWVDIALFILLLLAILMVWPEVLTHANVHVIPGLLLMGGVIVHLYLHRNWIKMVFRNYRKMTRSAQEKALVNLALMVAYLIAGVVGAVARLMLYNYPQVHIHLGILHGILIVPLFTLQTIHVWLHFKWIKKNVQTRILR
ncbi:MAG: hypothetical protein KA586_01160 [Candidatus Promineofilum sp.]|nr:hypothetical protein [Promineifilum sp.]